MPTSLPATELQARLWAHPFEDNQGALAGFVARLAMEQHWSRAKALGAIEQYRRFCFLACVSDTPMTPSEEVDCVWHLHLLYTRDYWEEFCPRVLGRSLHHGPTRGGAAEESRFYEQYAQTLALYQVHFGAPPDAFWPPARTRFQPASRWRWIYLPDSLILPSPGRLWRALARKIPPFMENA